MGLSLLVCGDVAPIGVSPLFFQEKGGIIFEVFESLNRQVDFSIVNLEAPVVELQPTPIKKSGPCLGVAPSTIKILKNVSFNVFTLANNHFFDQGQEGVENTINKCREEGINTVGGECSFQQARKPLILEKANKSVAIINACENEFSIANQEHGGCNPLDLINITNDIFSVKDNADYIVVIIHGGIEQYHYPTPRMKRLYHHFVDLGADVVINHHQHCINGYEVYNEKPIFYGLGNFYFPWNGIRPDSWCYGYAVRLLLDEQIKFELIPYKQTAEAITLRDKAEFEEELVQYNLPIQSDQLLQQQFDKYVMDRANVLKTQLLPSFLTGKYFSAMARHGWLGELYKGKDLYSIKNKLTCESHYETLKQLFTLLAK